MTSVPQSQQEWRKVYAKEVQKTKVSNPLSVMKYTVRYIKANTELVYQSEPGADSEDCLDIIKQMQTSLGENNMVSAFVMYNTFRKSPTDLLFKNQRNGQMFGAITPSKTVSSLDFTPNQPAATYKLFQGLRSVKSIWDEYYGLNEFHNTEFNGGVQALTSSVPPSQQEWRTAYSKEVQKTEVTNPLSKMKCIVSYIESNTKLVYQSEPDHGSEDCLDIIKQMQTYLGETNMVSARVMYDKFRKSPTDMIFINQNNGQTFEAEQPSK